MAAPSLPHLLGLTSPDANSMTGSYAFSGWNVVHVAGTNHLHALMATQHEAEHAALNASSAWGTVLLAFHVAHVKTGDPAFLTTLTDLVRRCRITHEAFATHASTFVISSLADPTPSELLSGYPEYAHFHELAQRTGPNPDSRPYWHGIAVTSALMASMQTPVLERLAEHGFEGFSPPARILRESDNPDSRFRALRQVGSTMWKELERTLPEALGRDRWDLLRRTQPEGVPGIDDFGPDVWGRLQAVTFTTASHALRQLGFATPTIEEVTEAGVATLTTLRSIVPEADRIFGPPGDFRTEALSLFELENLILHARRPARIRRWSDRGGAPLISGASPRRHVYVCVRSLQRLRQQFDLDAGHLADLPPSTAVVAVVAPPGRQEDDSLSLFVLDRPQQLAEIPAAGTDLGTMANYSLACSLQLDWSNAWLPALRSVGRTTGLFDTLPRRTVPKLLESGLPVRYALIRVRHGQQESFVLCLRHGDDPLLLLPCSYAAGQALASWIHYVSGERLRSDLNVLGRDAEHVVPVVVRHLVGDESVVGVWTG